jgi:hypothetical protein
MARCLQCNQTSKHLLITCNIILFEACVCVLKSESPGTRRCLSPGPLSKKLAVEALCSPAFARLPFPKLMVPRMVLLRLVFPMNSMLLNCYWR